MAKKKITKKNENIENVTNINSLWKIIIIVMIAFGLFYGLTYFIAENNKSYSWENKETSSVIQYDEIIFGTMLSESPKKYYVLAFNHSDEDKDIFNTYMAMYRDKENSSKVYTIDLDSDFNKKYIKENKVNEITLFKIENSKITEHIVGKENVIKKFKELIK